MLVKREVTSSNISTSPELILVLLIFVTNDQLSLIFEAGFLTELLRISYRYLAKLYNGLPIDKTTILSEVESKWCFDIAFFCDGQTPLGDRLDVGTCKAFFFGQFLGD